MGWDGFLLRMSALLDMRTHLIDYFERHNEKAAIYRQKRYQSLVQTTREKVRTKEISITSIHQLTSCRCEYIPSWL